MEFNEIVALINKYARRPFLEKFSEWEGSVSPEFLADIADNFIGMMYRDEFNVDFNDIRKLEYTYTNFFPKEYDIDGINAPVCFFTILDFYGFLKTEKKISEKKYLRALDIIIRNRETFFQNMNDTNFWSKRKKEIIQEEDELISKELLTEEVLKKLIGLADDSTDMKVKKDKTSKKNQAGKPDVGAYQIRVDLKGFKPPIWRRAVIEAHQTYENLHEVIQGLFEWDNCHLYNFEAGKKYIALKNEDDFFQSTMKTFDSTKTLFDEDLVSLGKINYTYDFGDDWEHQIKLEKILSADEAKSYEFLPMCIKGSGDAPLEDSRSMEMFEPFDLEYINDKLQGDIY